MYFYELKIFYIESYNTRIETNVGLFWDVTRQTPFLKGSHEQVLSPALTVSANGHTRTVMGHDHFELTNTEKTVFPFWLQFFF